MNEQFGPIGDMITLVASSQHAEATPVLHDLLGARILDALQGHKQVIAQSLFAPSADALSEESEQLDEISKATAFRVGEKRYKKGSATHAAGERSADPLTKKVLLNKAKSLFGKSTKAFEYAKKKD